MDSHFLEDRGRIRSFLIHRIIDTRRKSKSDQGRDRVFSEQLRNRNESLDHKSKYAFAIVHAIMRVRYRTDYKACIRLRI